MEHGPTQLIDYFRRCYRADNYGISISDVSRLPASRQLLIDGEEELASGGLPYLPLVAPHVETLVTQTEKYQKERLLIYGCFFVRGKVKANSGFSATRTLNSPLIYFPAKIAPQDATYCLSIDQDDLRINRPLLRQLLKPELDTSVLESFPALSFPIALDDVAQLSRWIREYTLIEDTESLGRWPKLLDDEAESSHLNLYCGCRAVLAERAKGSRGVLYELSALSDCNSLSPALSYVFGQNVAASGPSVCEPELIPGLLSAPQLTALENAAKETVSLISGPPGTGKSYTIAAIAIDRMLHGESVLVVSKSEQAINVVGEKLAETFNMQQGYVHTPEKNFQNSMKTYLEGLLSMGVASAGDSKQLKSELGQLQKTLSQLSQTFERRLGVSRWISHRIAQSANAGWLGKLYGRCVSWFSGWCAPEVLWQYPNQLGALQKEREKMCANYINAYRAEQLQTLLNTKRGELSKFLQALKARTSKTQEERFAQTNLSEVLAAFPVWLVNVNELNRVLPLQAGLFDVVIFDEATQCDMATAIPALQRAKRAVVVGDAKQLRHVSFISRREQRALYEYCQLDPGYAAQYNYRDQSVLDVVSDAIQSQTAVCMLDEYYRGKADLISFSNTHFYQNRLKVMRSRPGEMAEPALDFTHVGGERTRAGRNQEEVSHILEKLRAHIATYDSALVKPSVGVLSPFREQAQFLEKRIQETFSEADIQAYKLRVATPYGFQGEERDVMLLSMAIDDDSARAASYLNRPDMFNVAVTRAKERMQVYYSVDPKCLSSDNLFRRYLEHTHLPETDAQSFHVRCDFAAELSTALEALDVRCWQGFEVAGVEIDVLCQYQGRLLGIDLIGFPGDFHDFYDVNTYKRLIRSGIEVLPMPYSAWNQDKHDCLRRIQHQLSDQPPLTAKP